MDEAQNKVQKTVHTNAQTDADLKAMGFKDAAIHNGVSEALKQALEKFRNAYLCSDGVNESDNARVRRKAILEKINQIKIDISEQQSKIAQIAAHKIPEKETELNEIEQNISEIDKDMAEGKLDVGYSPIKKYLYLSLTIIMGIGLILFYTSLIYNALFKNLMSAALSVNANNVDDMMSAFLQIEPLFTPNAATFVSYILAFVFIGLGCVHMLIRINNKYGRILTILLLYLIALGAEVLFAVKMERNIEQMNAMFNPVHNIVQEGFFQTALHLDVFLVIVLGFITYIVWGIFFNGLITENQKRNNLFSGRKLKEVKKKDIARIRKIIGLLKQDLEGLNLEIEKLNHKMNELMDQLNIISFDKNDLLNQAGNYFDGWMRYINLKNKGVLVVSDCQGVFQAFKAEILHPKNQEELNTQQ